MKINDVILRNVAKIGVFIILTFGVYLFLSGHNTPGGGFIGGLVLASAFVLLYLSNGIEKVHKSLPLDFKLVAAVGVFLGSLLFGVPFMSQTFAYFDLPIFGKTELTTVTIFEAGVALTVVGVLVTIILSISEDDS